MATFQLTPHQAGALDRLRAFSEEERSRCFVLRGYAGTGKTTLVGDFVRWLEERNVRAVLLATTGRAAKVLAEKTGRPAATIHSCIYRFDELQGADAPEEKAGAQLSMQFGMRDRPDPGQKLVYIVDEASMIPNTATTGGQVAQFGSGHLLKDFLAFTEGHRVVFVGDPCQLPPVSDESFSPALSPRYLHEQYRVPVRYAELSEIVRQDAHSEILQLAGRFRSDILQEKYQRWPKLMVPRQQSAHLYANEHELIEAYLQRLKQRDYRDAIMITNANGHCRRLNHRLRLNLLGDKQLQEEELLMVVQNSYLVPLSNGDQVVVKEVKPAGKRAGFSFLKVKLLDLNRNETFETLLIRDLLYNDYAGLQPEETQRLLIDFNQRMRNAGVSPKSEVYREAMLKDPYLNALRAKFGYVITCHKAQGGEWPQVFLNIQKSVFVQRDNALYRWFYTALTRASQDLHFNDGFWVHGFNKRQPQVAIRQFKEQQRRKRGNKPPRP